MLLHAKYSKGQIKIQEMAFVLLGIIAFFALVALFYFAIRSSSLTKEAEIGREDRARELVRRLSASPEFAFSGCQNCLDFDNALIIKERTAYQKFWGLDYLRIEKVYPNSDNPECNKLNYPDCQGVTIIKEGSEYGTPVWSFAALCRKESYSGEIYTKCELGKIYASGRAING